MNTLCHDVIGHIVTYLNNEDFLSARLVWTNIPGDKYSLYGEYIRFLIDTKRIDNMILQKHLSTQRVFDLFKNTPLHDYSVFDYYDCGRKIAEFSNRLDKLKIGDNVNIVNSYYNYIKINSYSYENILYCDGEIMQGSKHGLYTLYSIYLSDRLLEIYVNYLDSSYIFMYIDGITCRVDAY
jgi:hypothetical protein